jgi:hypothetical protein
MPESFYSSTYTLIPPVFSSMRLKPAGPFFFPEPNFEIFSFHFSIGSPQGNTTEHNAVPMIQRAPGFWADRCTRSLIDMCDGHYFVRVNAELAFLCNLRALSFCSQNMRPHRCPCYFKPQRKLNYGICIADPANLGLGGLCVSCLRTTAIYATIKHSFGAFLEL